MVTKKAKTKSKVRVATSKRGLKKRAISKRAVMGADVIGISPAHILSDMPDRPVPVAIPSAALVRNVPIADKSTADVFCQKRAYIRRPLVPPRTSFWLGVGFGIFVTGVLGYLAWQLFNLEITEAIMLSFGL